MKAKNKTEQDVPQSRLNAGLDRILGNCPVCGFATYSKKSNKTPRHGHIKSNWYGEDVWLPPCKGSGQIMDNLQYVPLSNGELELMELDLVKELTELADKGFAVNLIYDDNGNWAFSAEGTQNCRAMPDDDLSITHCVKGSAFRPSIEEAWAAFVEENKGEF